MNCGDGLVGSPISIELMTLRLLSSVERDCSHVWEGIVAVDSGNHRINSQVPALNEKIQDYHVSMPCSVGGS